MAEQHTNIDAHATNTMAWLASPDTVLVVPVYQRHYRWTVAVGGRLLADIRRIADADARQTHFIGSILASRSDGGGEELMLIDGQQRVVTLTLLIAALRQAARENDPGLARELTVILEHPRFSGRTRVRPHRTGLKVLDGVVFDRPMSAADLDTTLYDENYAYFLGEIAGDAPRVWRGLQRLEHVTIALGEHANPQQVFESMNATGAPLKSDELIHNYVLMGLTHAQQVDIEDGFWTQIESNTDAAVEEFFRDYLVLKTWRDDHFKGEHGVYDVFREQFPSLRFDRLKDREAPEWLRYSEIYRVLLTPSAEQDGELARHLTYVATFGRAMYPLLLDVYGQFRRAAITRDELLEILGLLQSLFIRKMVVGESRDGIIARLCKTWGKSCDLARLQRDMVRRTPSDDRVRTALQYRYLPHAGYVLGRLQGRDALDGLEIEHIFPTAPASSWRGCEEDKSWGERSEEEKARLRELANTLGNLTLLEQPLNAGAGNHSFDRKQQLYYGRSHIGAVQRLLDEPCWGADQILARTTDLTTSFLEIWPRPVTLVPRGDGQLTPILEVPRRPGYYPGWATEYEYAVFRGEILEVRNIRQLFIQVVSRLLDERRDAVLAWRNGELFSKAAEHAQYELIAPSLYVNMAWIPQYHLKAIQDLVDEFDTADDLLIKFASDEADDEVIESFAEPANEEESVQAG
jgi:Protein of unknown function DUF262/Protein of unknown function (DUF1524)